MKIVKQSCDVISGLKPMEHIEKIGRICYKSEDKIEEGRRGGAEHGMTVGALSEGVDPVLPEACGASPAEAAEGKKTSAIFMLLESMTKE